MKHWTQRQGVWVETEQGVGIRIFERVLVKANGARALVGADTAPGEGERLDFEPWIHLTNKDGTTLAQIPEAACKGLRIARRASIPQARIAALTDAQLTALGYV